MRKNSSGGFTLVEIAIALTIVALLLIPGIKLLEAWQEQSKVAANQQRMDAIQQALTTFMTLYGRLPCPASFIAQPAEANYGREVAPLCSNPDGSPYTPDGKATFAATGRSTPVQTPPINSAIIIGAVPVRDLALPDSTRADVYGHLFTYAVSAGVTTVQNALTATGIIDVIDAYGHTVLPYASDRTSTGTALYVLVDHGKDGKGAYTDNPGPAVTTPAVPCDRAPGLDTLNCSFELPNPASPFAFRSAPLGLQPGPNWFDDTVSFYAPLSANILPLIVSTPPAPTAAASTPTTAPSLPPVSTSPSPSASTPPPTVVTPPVAQASPDNTEAQPLTPQQQEQQYNNLLQLQGQLNTILQSGQLNGLLQGQQNLPQAAPAAPQN